MLPCFLLTPRLYPHKGKPQGHQRHPGQIRRRRGQYEPSRPKIGELLLRNLRHRLFNVASRHLFDSLLHIPKLLLTLQMLNWGQLLIHPPKNAPERPLGLLLQEQGFRRTQPHQKGLAAAPPVFLGTV